MRQLSSPQGANSSRSGSRSNIHFHMLFLDGVYADHSNGNTRFRWVNESTSAELTQLAHTIGPVGSRTGAVTH